MFKIFRKINSDRRGVAMIEGLFVCLPIWLFFAIILKILVYWETNHLDHVMQLGDTMAYRLVSTKDKHLDIGDSKNKSSPTSKDKPQFYLEKITGSGKLPIYYFYITDYVSSSRSRKIMGMRRYNTWLSHPLLKGQNPQDEGRNVQKWYDDMGNKTLNDNRKALQLGS